MVNRLLVVTCAVVRAACGGSPGPSLGVMGPASAQSVASNSSDFTGLQKCPESGSYESYLKAEQTANPTQYQTDKATWDGMKAAGANDSFVTVYVEKTSDCGQFGSGTPSDKVAYVFAIRFKDDASASANYKTSSKGFHLSDPELSQLKAAGATVDAGATTGFGANSLVLSLGILGVSIYVAFWQNKEFEVAEVAFNEPTQAPAAAKKINERIH